MTEERGRIPPHSLEAEEGLLGSCLIDPHADILSKCLEHGLLAESFYKPAHQVVFQVILDLEKTNKVEFKGMEDRIPVFAVL